MFLILTYNNFMHQESQLQHLRQQLINLISSKKEQPYVTSKYTLDWKHAELLLIKKAQTQDLLNTWIDFQKVCTKNKVSCFHSFYVLQWSLNNPSNHQPIQKQRQQLGLNKSKYQRIASYIKMREDILGKVTQFGGKGLNQLFQNIDQIRFLNFEIVNLIKTWKEQWRCEGQQPLFYEKGTNYLFKINNDNADMINLANFKKTKFISPPNPFFLSQDGNFSGMSEEQRKQIDSCINLITKQRFFDIKLAFEGALFLVQPSSKSAVKRNQSQSKMLILQKQKQSNVTRQIRQKGQTERESEIRKIYAFKQSVSSSKLRAWKQANQNELRKESKQQKELISQQNLQKIKKVQSKIIELKQSYLVAPSEKRRFSSYTNKDNFVLKPPQNKKKTLIVNANPDKKKEETKVQTETDHVQIKTENNYSSLRQTVTKTLLSSKQPMRTSRMQEVREIKPKIKLISERQVPVQQNIQAVASFSISQLFSSAQDPKSSTFYKSIEPVVEESQQDNQLPRPLTNSLSKLKSSTQVVFSGFKAVESKKKEESMSKSKILNKSLTKRISQSSFVQTNPKSLSIINIYRNSVKKIKKSKEQSPSKVDNIEKQKVKDQSLLVTKPKSSKKLQQSRSLNQKQIQKSALELKQKQNRRSQIKQTLVQKSKTRAEVEQKLSEKVKVIQQLESKIKEMEPNQKESPKKSQYKSKSQYNSVQSRQKKMKQIESKILRDKIQEEERKFKKVREEQIKLKEREIELQFKRQKYSLEQAHNKKLGDYKLALLAEEKKIKKYEQLYSGQQNKLSQIEYELAEKELKQKLLRKIISEKEREQEKKPEVVVTQEQTLQALGEQLRERQKIQLQQYQLIEKQRIRMQQNYKALLKQNEQMQQQILAKQAALNELQAQKMPQIQAAEPEEDNLTDPVQQPKQTQTEDKKGEQVDLETMKLKVKQQLLNEILKQQEIARLEEQRQEEIRKQKLKRIQLEVAEALRAQELKLELQYAQFLSKIQSLKNKSSILKSEEVAHNNLQSQQHPLQEKQIQHKQIQDVPQPISGEVQKHKEQESLKQNKTVQKVEKIEQAAEIKEQGNTFFITTEIEVENMNREQSVIDHFEVELNERQLHKEKLQKKTDPTQSAKVNQETAKTKQAQVLLPNKAEAQKEKQEVEIVPEVNANKQADILQKYKLLLPMLRKGTTIVVEDYNLPTFIEAFLSSFDKQLRQMLPLTKEVLERNLRVKKGDIFDSGAIGWLEQNQKYNLVGSMDCLDSIIKKYGCVQIHQIYHLDKSSSYQKQAIAKKIREFQKIGYVYQKKVEKNIYSIRFVLILPKSKVQPPKVFGTKLITRMNIEGHKDNDQAVKQTHGFSYLLARLLKEACESSQLQQRIQKQSSHFNQVLKRQLQKKQPLSKGVELSEGKDSIEMIINLPLKYYREKDRLFYLVSTVQHSLDQKLTYVSHFGDNLGLVIQPINQELPPVPLDYSAFQLVDKLNKTPKIRQIDVVLPVWSYSSHNYLQDLAVSYAFKEKLSADLNFWSVSSTFLIKHTFVQVKAPFIFIICQWYKQGVNRIIHSHMVRQEELRYQKGNK